MVKISYDQENLLKIFEKLNKVNTQFVEQSAQQIKIKKNAKILEDSLLALAGRVFEIESIVTKELFLMNEHLDGSLKSIRDRKIGKITNNQQFAMTSMNNLALLLSEVSQKMQQKMSQCMKGNQNCSKPEGKKPSQSKGIGKLQKALSGKIKEMKKSGEQGKSASESFAKMAAEQGKLKQALKEMEKMMEKGKQGNGNMGKLDKLMEENEIDLLNKRITQETINRQQEILTKLLEAEKSLREREWDDKRESNTATQNNNSLPPDIQEYLNKRNKEIEQLKTISPNFSPYYKVKVGEYFKVN